MFLFTRPKLRERTLDEPCFSGEVRRDLEIQVLFAGTASPEDQLKSPVAILISDAGSAVGLKIESRTETHLSEHNVRPDIAIYTGGLICGYVELKAPGLGGDASKLKGKHNKEQWEKLKALPNLIYTDGREWALYRSGERKGPVVRFDDDPTDKGKAAVTTQNADALNAIFQDFLTWLPAVPHKPTELAKYLAPLSRFLRAEVEAALATPGSNIEALAAEWRNYFFPTADNAQFADAYAQTVSYAMLLARLSGAVKLDPHDAAKTLDQGNRLLARTLELLGQEGARDELRVGFELLQRSLEALDPFIFLKSKPDLWLYFYEDFLAAYDPKLRHDYGVYYTPREVVELQVRLVGELLEKRFGKKLGFADDGVVFLDPAVGTGTYSDAQVFLSTLLTNALAEGQAMVATSLIPDLHHFRGSFGGKDIIPLYRDADAKQPNITKGLLGLLGKQYGTQPTVEDLAAYIYALLGGQNYTKRFWSELETPGPRVPLTKDGKAFAAAVSLGRRLLWLHTYAQRFRGQGRGDEVPAGNAKSVKGISSDPAQYPESFRYDEAKLEICVGSGRFGPVKAEVWDFEVSGLKVVQSWLGYRMKKRAGKKSSALDEIRPDHWTPQMTDEFLELLWVLEATITMEPKLCNILDVIANGVCFKASELPAPTNDQREPPNSEALGGDLLEMMESGDELNGADDTDE